MELLSRRSCPSFDDAIAGFNVFVVALDSFFGDLPGVGVVTEHVGDRVRCNIQRPSMTQPLNNRNDDK